MINSLKGVTEINGKRVMTNEERPLLPGGSVDWEKFDRMREEFPICIDHEKDMISFKMLTKAASEGGNLANAQLTELIATAKMMLEYLDDKFPCDENYHTIFHLDEALKRQEERTANREARGVEGKNEA